MEKIRLDAEHPEIVLRKSRLTSRRYVHFETCTDFKHNLASDPYCKHTDKDCCLPWCMWIPYLNPTVVGCVQAAGFCLTKITERDYTRTRGAVWDHVDHPSAEKDLLSLSPMMMINRLMGTQSICRKTLLSFNYRWTKECLEADCIIRESSNPNQTQPIDGIDALLENGPENCLNFTTSHISDLQEEKCLNSLDGEQRKDENGLDCGRLNDLRTDEVEADLLEFDFLPESYNLPQERDELVQRMKRSLEHEFWIVKPNNMSCGQGIEIVARWLDLPSCYSKQEYTVQKYIHPPCTINNRKFDLRLYLLITGVAPLRMYLYKEGLVRFATEEYNVNLHSINNKYVHLTNYAVNRDHPNQQWSDSDRPETKWTLSRLWSHLEKEGVDTKAIWSRLTDLSVKTVLSGLEEMRLNRNIIKYNQQLSYKLIGLDVLLDAGFKAWLLEANSFPSMFTQTVDLIVNPPMVAEMFNIIGFQPSKMISNVVFQDDNSEDQGSADENRNPAIPPPGLTPPSSRRFASRTDVSSGANNDPKSAVAVQNATVLQTCDNFFNGLATEDLEMLGVYEDELMEVDMFESIFPSQKHFSLMKRLDLNGPEDNLLHSFNRLKQHQRDHVIDRLQHFLNDRRH